MNDDKEKLSAKDWTGYLDGIVYWDAGSGEKSEFTLKGLITERTKEGKLTVTAEIAEPNAVYRVALNTLSPGIPYEILKEREQWEQKKQQNARKKSGRFR